MGVKTWLNASLERYWPPEPERQDLSLAFNTWAEMISSFQYQGLQYTLPGATQEDIGGSFAGMARGAYKGNGIVFAVMAVRMDLFSQGRFMFQRVRNGRPGDYFGTPELRLLNVPWVGGTTGDLLARMIMFADIAGNAYVVRRPGRLTPLRPDWVTIVGGVEGNVDATVWHPDATVLGYLYQEGGPSLGRDPEFFFADQVAHFAPRPDPEARFRGMSWLSPIVTEIMADKAMTDHRLKFFENGATPNLAVTLNVDSLDKYRDWIKELKGNHDGIRNAYKTLFLASGADAKVLGADMKQIDFKVTQGGGETRVAAAGGTPPVIVGLSEGLDAATYSNYSQAMRRMIDITLGQLWANASGSLANIINVPSDAQLAVDPRDIRALHEDQRDAAEIQGMKSQSVRTLVDAGFTADSVIAAVESEDFSLLKHSGLFSVQLQPPGTLAPAALPALNGANSNRSRELVAALTDPEE